jgi:hypothetical protein
MVKKITCKGGKENHTKINVLLMQAEVVRACKAKFDEQLCRVYTRAVYQEYKKNTIPAPRLSSDQIQTHS